MLRLQRNTVSMILGILVMLLVCEIEVCNGLEDVAGYYKWAYGNRTELYCVDSCRKEKYPDKCCACDGLRCWEMDDACPIYPALLEYIDVYGNADIIVPVSNATYVKLEYPYGRLINLPRNLCTFADQLVIIDLRANRLTNVSALRCLHKLDTLLLDDNLITVIRNDTFTQMLDLRILSVKNNLIKQLEPNVLTLQSGNILSADFSENLLFEVIDVTNLFSEGPYCQKNVSHSTIETLTNEHGYSIIHALHGPGDIDLEFTQIGSFFNFSTLGVNVLGDLGKYFDGTIHVDNSSAACDCTMYPFLSSFDQYEIIKYWPNIYEDNFYCQSPESMKGKNLRIAYEEGDFDSLTCDISEQPDCPSHYCQCIQQPSQDKILVNCTAVGFTSMPDRMPVGPWGLNKIELILSKNDIQRIDHRDYLDRLVSLDLRQNSVRYFDERASKELNAPVNFEDQRMTNLPVAMKNKDPALYTFGEHPINCDCSNLWIGDWIRFENGHGRLKCSTPDMISSAEHVTDKSLNCNAYQVFPFEEIISPVVAFITCFVMIIGLCYVFKYDIILLKRRLWSKQNSVEPSDGLYDVFVSFYSDNREVFGTIQRHLRPELIKAGYSVFVPCFDIMFGDADLEAIKAVGMSRNYIIVLCDNYAENFETRNELNSIWTSFIQNESKHIVVINFDNIDPFSVKNRRLRALRRSRFCLDFTDRGSKLITRLFKLIGKPTGVKPDQDKKEVIVEKEAVEVNDGSEKGKVDEPAHVTSDDVYMRLAIPKSSKCNCVYRKCYLHAGALDGIVKHHDHGSHANMSTPSIE